MSKAKSILAGNLNSGLSYPITTVCPALLRFYSLSLFYESDNNLVLWVEIVFYSTCLEVLLHKVPLLHFSLWSPSTCVRGALSPPSSSVVEPIISFQRVFISDIKSWSQDFNWYKVITIDCVYKDSKYRQMALISFGTQTTELGL